MGVRRAAWAINPACAWGPLAQLVERHVYTVDVVGSSPAGPTPAARAGRPAAAIGWAGASRSRRGPDDDRSAVAARGRRAVGCPGARHGRSRCRDRARAPRRRRRRRHGRRGDRARAPTCSSPTIRCSCAASPASRRTATRARSSPGSSAPTARSSRPTRTPTWSNAARRPSWRERWASSTCVRSCPAPIPALGLGRVGRLARAHDPRPAGEAPRRPPPAHRDRRPCGRRLRRRRRDGGPLRRCRRLAARRSRRARPPTSTSPPTCGTTRHPRRVSRRSLGGGPALIDVSHWASEWLWLDAAAAELRAAHPDLEFAVSELRTDPWDFQVVQ